MGRLGQKLIIQSPENTSDHSYFSDITKKIDDIRH